MASCPHRCTIYTTENQYEPGSCLTYTRDNKISIFKDTYSIIRNTIHSWNASLAGFRDIQKISTHVVEVSSKLIKDITIILHHNGLLIMTINEICVIQNNLITSGQTLIHYIKARSNCKHLFL